MEYTTSDGKTYFVTSVGDNTGDCRTYEKKKDGTLIPLFNKVIINSTFVSQKYV